MATSTNQRLRIAVVGAGVSGIVAAHRLARLADVTLLERRPRLGGHTHTWIVPDGPDAGTAVDTGFIVCNDKTYPNFHRFLAELGVGWRWSDMSFGFHDEVTGLQYAGTDLNGLFAQRANIVSPRFLTMLLEIRRFARQAMADIAANEDALARQTLGQYLARHRFSAPFINDYLVPMGAAIWSTPPGRMLRFPALAYIRFFRNHGLLGLADRPRWQTIIGGSHSYLRAFERQFPGRIELGAHIRTIRRDGAGVRLVMDDGTERPFDKVVLGVHADQVLPLLEKPTDEERELFGVWRYQANRVVLHTDVAVMPPNRRAWASWNYTREAGTGADGPLSMTYDMNRLQGLRTRRRYLVTLNRRGPIDPRRVIAEFVYTHPLYTRASIATQPRVAAMQGTMNTYYVGAWQHYGFHEDGTRSAVEVARLLGVPGD